MNGPHLRLTEDDQIRLAHGLALSYWGNPRNFEYPHRRTVELKARKIAGLLSPLNRCSVCSEYNFWRWLRAKSDDAPDVVADFNDGVPLQADVGDQVDEDEEDDEDDEDSDEDEKDEVEEGSVALEEVETQGNVDEALGSESTKQSAEDEAEGVENSGGAIDSPDSSPSDEARSSLEEGREGDRSLVSTASTVRLGNIHFRACDVTIFYTHLPQGLPASFSINEKWLDIPLVLIEIKRNTRRKLSENQRGFSFSRNLKKAKRQLGEQADLIFSNHRYNAQQFVIGMAMAGEAWSYAEFWRRDRPKRDETQESADVKWVLPEDSWSDILFWGSDDSETHISLVMQRMRVLISSCGITPIL